MTFGSDYDAWLERPYVEAARIQEEVEKYADAHDLPLETDEDWEAATEAMESEAAAAEEDHRERMLERWGEGSHLD